MKIDNEFELLAIRHGLSLNKNEHGYLDPKMKLAHIFYYSRQHKIDMLEHDLRNEKCASAMLSEAIKIYESKEVKV